MLRVSHQWINRIMVGRLLESHFVSSCHRIEVLVLLNTHGTSRRKWPLHLDVRMSGDRTIKHWELACAVCQCEREPKMGPATYLPPKPLVQARSHGP